MHTMPSAQTPFPDVSVETQPCEEKMTAEGKVTPEQSATIAVSNAARLEACAKKLEAVRRIIVNYLEIVK